MPPKSVEAIVKEKKISEVVNPKLVQAPPEITLEQAVKLMHENKAGYIVIAKNKKVAGLFSETDVVMKVLGLDVDWSKPVSEFMSPNPLVLLMNDSVGRAIELMGENRIYHIPLVDEKQNLVNVLSVRTLIRFLAGFYPTEIYNLPPDPTRVIGTVEGG